MTPDMPTKNIQDPALPKITLEVTTALETGITLQRDTHQEIDITPITASTPETEITLQDDIHPETDMPHGIAKLAITKGHLTDKDLNHPITEGMTIGINTSKAETTAATGIIPNPEIEAGHILEGETIITPLTDPDFRPQVQHQENAMNAEARTT